VTFTCLFMNIHEYIFYSTQIFGVLRYLYSIQDYSWIFMSSMNTLSISCSHWLRHQNTLRMRPRGRIQDSICGKPSAKCKYGGKEQIKKLHRPCALCKNSKFCTSCGRNHASKWLALALHWNKLERVLINECSIKMAGEYYRSRLLRGQGRCQ
jgi:hypothetical protein